MALAATPRIEPSPSADVGRGRGAGLAVAAALAVVYVVWGSTYLAIRVAIATVPPFFMAGTRFLVAGALLFAFAAARGGHAQRWPDRRAWLAAFVIGGALLTVGNGGVSYAEQYVPSGTAALMVSTIPIWMVALGRIFWRERFPWHTWLGIGVGFAGMALLVWPQGGHYRGIGFAVLIVAAFSWALGSLYARRAPLPQAYGMGTAMEMLAGGALLMAVSALSGEIRAVHVDQVTLASAGALAYLILFGSLLAYTCYTWLLRHADTGLVSTYAYVNPVVAVALGTAFLGEPLTPRTLVAAAVIILGVALIVSRPRLPGRRRPRVIPSS